jgi:hypothetical protein
MDLYNKVITIETGVVKDVLIKNEWYFRHRNYSSETKISVDI